MSCGGFTTIAVKPVSVQQRELRFHQKDRGYLMMHPLRGGDLFRVAFPLAYVFQRKIVRAIDAAAVEFRIGDGPWQPLDVNRYELIAGEDLWIKTGIAQEHALISLILEEI